MFNIKDKIMKKYILGTFAVSFLVVFFFGCSAQYKNSVTFKNISDGDLLVNFRGNDISIPAGQSAVIKEIPKGTYNYATTFSVPAGTTSASSQGNLTGTVNVKASTKILLLYSSTLFNGTYTIYVTISNSDDQSATPTVTGP